MSVLTETFVGNEPPAPVVTPLPTLGSSIANPGSFSIIMPVQIDYAVIAKALQGTLASRMALQDVSVYPSLDKLVISLRPAPTSSAPSPTAIFLTAKPAVDESAGTITLPDLGVLAGSLEAAPEDVVRSLTDNDLLANLKSQAITNYKPAFDRIVAAINARFGQSSSGSFKTEGNIQSVSADHVTLLANSVRVDFRGTGHVKLVWAP